MRNAFCQAMVAEAGTPSFIFLTGDLGFKALEPLRDVLGTRFINAGVAEQNMVSVAAGLARVDLAPWVYSIAPFVFARPFEQIRNDVCLHDLPVRLVGNGGGYAYGVMGATHHAIEDYGALLCLPHMHVFVPAFDADIPAIVHMLRDFPHPAYLRLGLSEEPKDWPVPPYAAWRKLLDGSGPTLLVTGPLVGGILAEVRHLDETTRPNLWLLSELPIVSPPSAFIADVQRTSHLIVVEEHVAHGGVGEMIAHSLMRLGVAPQRFVHQSAQGYVSGLYGSQKFHRKECGLDPQSIISLLNRES